jgi:hypothetical protein
MGNNTFTELFADGTALTQTQLETALQTLKPDISNTTGMTTGSTSGQFLKSNGDGLAASFASVPDPLGPFAIRNYGLSTSTSSGKITVSLKTNAGTDPSATDKVNLTFSNNGTTSATYTAVDVSSALSIQMKSSCSYGATGTAATRVYVYAMNNSGTPILGVSLSSDLDKGVAVTTGSITNPSTVATQLAATAALTVVPRLLGWIDAAYSGSAWTTPTRTAVSQSTNYKDIYNFGYASSGAVTTSLNTASFTAAVFDGGSNSSYWTNSHTTRLLVPSGAKVVRLVANAQMRAVLNTNNGITFQIGVSQNGATTPSYQESRFFINSNGASSLTTTLPVSFTTPPIAVVEGDYFELKAKFNDLNSGNSASIQTATTLYLEVIR